VSRQSKRELIEKLRPKYLAADKKGKGEILDMVVYATEYHRKYAIALLRSNPRKTA